MLFSIGLLYGDGSRPTERRVVGYNLCGSRLIKHSVVGYYQVLADCIFNRLALIPKHKLT